MKRPTLRALALCGIGVMLIASTAAVAATRTVPSTLYTTVQEAVDAAVAGDTILIRPGTYEEFVSIDTDRLRLIGNCASPRSVILDGNDGGTGLSISAEGVEVRCLTLRHYSYGIDVEDYDDLFVYKVHFRNCDDGIYGDSDGFRVVTSVFFGCEDSSMDFDGEDGSVTSCTSNNGGGFEIEGDGLVFRDNSVEQPEDEDCLDYDGNGAVIERLYCDGADDYGIDVDGDDNLIRYNTVRNTYSEGIYIDGDGNTVDRNEVTNADGYGIEVCGDDNTIRWNKVTAAESECFYIDGDNLLIEGNEATNCIDDCFEIDGDRLVVKDNSAVNCIDVGFDIDCRGDYLGYPTYDYEDCTVATVTGNTSKSTGEDEDGFEVSGEFMTFARNEARNSFEAAFDLSLDDSTIEYNKAYWTGSEHEDAYEISGDDNTIRSNVGQYNAGGACLYVSGDDNLLKSNSCRDNLADGFDVNGSRNRLEFNVSQRNEGEGLQNGGTATEFYRNTSRDNRIDCADDSGTVALDSANICADGSDLATTPEEIDP